MVMGKFLYSMNPAMRFFALNCCYISSAVKVEQHEFWCRRGLDSNPACVVCQYVELGKLINLSKLLIPQLCNEYNNVSET